MTFLSDLARLREAATKGPWLARPEYGCRNPEHWEVAPDKVFKVGVPAEIARVWNYEEKDQPNAELIAYLVNHAEAIEELVRAVEKIVTVDNRIEANKAFYDMTKALEKLNRSE